MKVKALQADSGDSILLSFKDINGYVRNILIDTGLKRTYVKVLKGEIQQLKNLNQCIDLLILTHIDHDHIGGALALLEDPYWQEELPVKEIWINSGMLIGKSFENSTSGSDREIYLFRKNGSEISYRQGIKLELYLQKNNIKTNYLLHFPCVINFHGMEINILSPYIETLQDLNSNWQIETGQMKNQKIYNEKNDYDKSIRELSMRSFSEDNSLVNKSSLCFLTSYEGKRILFGGDSHPSEVVKSLTALGYTTNKKIKVDLWKLSHHGSKGSTNNKILELVDTNKFLVSTSGMRFNHPHKETFSRILTCSSRTSQKITFFFNYSNQKTNGIFKPYEYEEYNFECSFSQLINI